MMKLMFYSIEINLLLWLAVCGSLWSGMPQSKSIAYLATIGCAVAAVVQHWAYHRNYKKS